MARYGAWVETLDREAAQLIYRYSMEAHQGVNRALRAEAAGDRDAWRRASEEHGFIGSARSREKEARKILAALDRAVREAPPLEHRLLVYRAMKDHPTFIPDDEAMTFPIAEPAFISTSLLEAKAYGHLTHGQAYERVMLEIELEPGTKAIFVDPLNLDREDDEYELILPRRGVWQVKARVLGREHPTFRVGLKWTTASS